MLLGFQRVKFCLKPSVGFCFFLVLSIQLVVVVVIVVVVVVVFASVGVQMPNLVPFGQM